MARLWTSTRSNMQIAKLLFWTFIKLCSCSSIMTLWLLSILLCRFLWACVLSPWSLNEWLPTSVVSHISAPWEVIKCTPWESFHCQLFAWKRVYYIYIYIYIKVLSIDLCQPHIVTGITIKGSPTRWQNLHFLTYVSTFFSMFCQVVCCFFFNIQCETCALAQLRLANTALNDEMIVSSVSPTPTQNKKFTKQRAMIL